MRKGLKPCTYSHFLKRVSLFLNAPRAVEGGARQAMDGLTDKTEKPSLRKWDFFRND